MPDLDQSFCSVFVCVGVSVCCLFVCVYLDILVTSGSNHILHKRNVLKTCRRELVKRLPRAGHIGILCMCSLKQQSAELLSRL